MKWIKCRESSQVNNNASSDNNTSENKVLKILYKNLHYLNEKTGHGINVVYIVICLVLCTPHLQLRRDKKYSLDKPTH